MTCYFKNSRMVALFKDIGVVVTKDNKKAVDELLHEMLSVDYKNCAATRKMVIKKLDGNDSDGFKARLQHALSAFREL